MKKDEAEGEKAAAPAPAPARAPAPAPARGLALGPAPARALAPAPGPGPAPANAPPSRSTRSAVPFFVAVLAITWSLQAPAALAQRGLIPGDAQRFLPLLALGAFGPLIAAVIVSRFEAGGAGTGFVFRSLRISRVGVGWYLVALGIFTAIYVGGTAVYRLAGGSSPGAWLYPPSNSDQLVAMILFPIAEEPGWRGFALPRLQERYGRLQSSLILGVVWALWHTMMFIMQGMTPSMFAIASVNIVAGSVIFSWLFNHTRGSLLLAILLHIGAHLNNPTHALPAQVTPFAIYTAALAIVAIALIVVDKSAWRSPASGEADSRAPR